MQEEHSTEVFIIKDKLLKIKQVKRSLLLKKLTFIGLIIVILTVINSYELLSSGGSAVLTLVSTVLLLLYFFMV